MNRFFSSLVIGVQFAFLSQTAWSADLEAGKRTSMTCIACHGVNGISNAPIWPNLAGQKKDYLIKQLKAYQDESRKDPMMSPVAKTLSAQDIENVSAYFSGLKAEAPKTE